MATNEEIIKEAEYYLNNDVTVEQASIDLGISKRSLQLHLKKLEEIALETFKLIKEKKEKMIEDGRAKGGTIGKRGPTWTEDQALMAAQLIIDQGLTYQEAEDKLGIPSSTLHEMVHKGVKDSAKISLLYAIAEANHHGMTLEEYQAEHNRNHVNVDQISKEIIDNNIESSRKK